MQARETSAISNCLGLLILIVCFGMAIPALALDEEAAQKAFRKCAACHELGPNAKSKVGPPLNGILDRQIGQNTEFQYSKAFKKVATDKLVWSRENLDAFLTKPRIFIKGTRMSFSGIRKSQQRKLIIDWISLFDADGRKGGGVEISPKEMAAQTNLESLLGASAASLEGDPEFGEYLSGECVTCHKLSGAAQGIPSITGWSKETFIHAMYEYKTKVRKNPVMQTVAGRLSDDELAGLAAYFGSLQGQ